jgi:hypothetical protein
MGGISMKRNVMSSFIVVVGITLFCGCGHTHTWSEATCTEPKKCIDCGEIDGESLGHDFAEATCKAPATCIRCGLTDGAALEHIFTEATCESPATCTLCGETDGKALGHEYSEATCTVLATCSRCGQTTGSLKEHNLTDIVVIVEPSCTDDGEQSGVCTECGQSVSEAMSKTGHTGGEYVVETKVTYNSAGQKVKRCTVCDEIMGTESYELSDEEKEEDFKADCSKYSYEDLARNPDAVYGDNVKLTGKVIQVLEDGNNCELRVNITKTRWGYTDTIYVSYTRKSDESRILEDDIVTLWGWSGGTISYTAVLGQTVTLPYVLAAYLTIN